MPTASRLPRERVIVHIYMDAFCAAIEQRDHPEYRGKPVIVGADPKGGERNSVKPPRRCHTACAAFYVRRPAVTPLSP